jgi:hypothetical protein
MFLEYYGRGLRMAPVGLTVFSRNGRHKTVDLGHHSLHPWLGYFATW